MASAARRHLHGACVLGIVLSLTVAGCSSSSSSESSTTSTKVDTSLLGPEKAATGSALTVGFISDGKNPVADNTVEIPAAQAAAKYVNEHLGGIAGRPLELKICETGQTPSGATDCVNQMIAAKVPIVLENVSGQAGPIAKGLNDAGIPLLVYGSGDQDTLLSPNSNVLTNTLAGLAGPVQLAKDNGVKKVAIVVIDVPAAAGPLKALAAPIYEQQNISADFVAVPPGTPDMTPQIQAALSKDPEQFSMIGDTSFCSSALKALKTLGFSGTIIIIPQCLSSETAKGVPGGLAGVKLISTESTDPKDPEVALYHAVMGTYAPGKDPHLGITSGGYAVVVGLARALSGLTGEVNPESVKAALLSSGQQPMPLLGKRTFECNRKVIVLTPAVCSSGAVIATLDKDGIATDTKAFNPTSVLPG